MAKELSERQRKILEFIRYFIGENRFPPTIREIGEKVGISSTSVVKYNLDVLVKRGLIERDADISRGIRLAEDLAQGRRLQTWVNGIPCSDYTDTDSKHFTPRGLIALQVHGGKQGQIRWRHLRIKELKVLTKLSKDR